MSAKPSKLTAFLAKSKAKKAFKPSAGVEADNNKKKGVEEEESLEKDASNNKESTEEWGEDPIFVNKRAERLGGCLKLPTPSQTDSSGVASDTTKMSGEKTKMSWSTVGTGGNSPSKEVMQPMNEASVDPTAEPTGGGPSTAAPVEAPQEKIKEEGGEVPKKAAYVPPNRRGAGGELKKSEVFTGGKRLVRVDVQSATEFPDLSPITLMEEKSLEKKGLSKGRKDKLSKEQSEDPLEIAPATASSIPSAADSFSEVTVRSLVSRQIDEDRTSSSCLNNVDVLFTDLYSIPLRSKVEPDLEKALAKFRDRKKLGRV